MGGEPAGGRGVDPENKLVRGERTLARVVDEPKGGRGESGASWGGTQEGERPGLATNSLWQVRKTGEAPRNTAKVSALQGWMG